MNQTYGIGEQEKGAGWTFAPQPAFLCAFFRGIETTEAH
jgi:hypothetical protein